MHVLRSTYLPAYSSLIRPPYSSDPFPTTPSPTSSHHPTPEIQRETPILDLFIALKIHEDVWTDDSTLHLEREESFKDLFDLMQPRSRVEDLVRAYGVREGLISAAPPNSPASPTTASRTKPIPFSQLSVSFSPRSVGLVLCPPGAGRKRTIVQVARSREERLEVAARRIVRELGGWVRGGW